MYMYIHKHSGILFGLCLCVAEMVLKEELLLILTLVLGIILCMFCYFLFYFTLQSSRCKFPMEFGRFLVNLNSNFL